MAAWSSICWENNLWAAVSAAPCPVPPAGGKTPNPRSSAARRRQDTKPPCPAPPAGGKTPNPRRPGGIVPPCPGVGKGAGPGGLWPPERRPGPAQREPRAGPRQGAAPTPPPGRWGGPAGGGRVRRRRGTDAGKAANPTPRRPQPATGPPPPRQSAPAGGLRPPAPRRPATRPDAGRPRAGRPAASHQPTPTAARAPGPGPDKAGPLRWGGGGRAGPVPARPAPDRPHTFAGPARHLWGRAGHRHGGGPGRRALQRPRQRPGRGAPGRPHTEQGPSLPVVGRRGGKKKCREACPPPAGHDWTKKNCGEDALSPPLAVIADPRFPPVRRNSPKRTLCRPVPYALVMRPPPGLRSCVP